MASGNNNSNTGGTAFPEIVCLCGSTKFKDEFREANKRLTIEGKIVLSVGFFGHVDGWPDEAGHESDTKIALDELHKRKIDLSDRVHVINADGYVGESTRSEIAYAGGRMVPVTWLEEPPGPNAGGCWICETGNGFEDDSMPLDMEFDTYYHPDCLDAAGFDSILEYESHGEAMLP